MFILLDKIENQLSFKGRLFSLGLLAIMLVSLNWFLVVNGNLKLSNSSIDSISESTPVSDNSFTSIYHKEDYNLAMVSKY